jgi:hypothetical protein
MDLFSGPRFYDHLIGWGKLFAGFALGHTLSLIHSPGADLAALLASGVLWGIGVVGINHQMAKGGKWVKAEESRRSIPNLNSEPAYGFVEIVNESQVDFTQLRAPAQQDMKEGIKEEQKLDKRIVSWAQGVTYWNAPMTQTKWCVGKNKTFSKPAYVAWMTDLMKDKIVVPVNPNADRSTYEANGGAGKAYIKALADNRIYRPFPTYKNSEQSDAFLRAQMRKGDSVGQGMD